MPYDPDEAERERIKRSQEKWQKVIDSLEPTEKEQYPNSEAHDDRGWWRGNFDDDLEDY